MESDKETGFLSFDVEGPQSGLIIRCSKHELDTISAIESMRIIGKFDGDSKYDFILTRDCIQYEVDNGLSSKKTSLFIPLPEENLDKIIIIFESNHIFEVKTIDQDLSKIIFNQNFFQHERINCNTRKVILSEKDHIYKTDMPCSCRKNIGFDCNSGSEKCIWYKHIEEDGPEHLKPTFFIFSASLALVLLTLPTVMRGFC